MRSTPSVQPGADENAAPGGGRIAVALAFLWLAVPALQYAGATARARLLAGAPVPGAEWLAGLDLAPFYALLLAATGAVAGTGWAAASRGGGSTVEEGRS